MQQDGMTIGRLAKAAGVGVETIRYYQQRHLLPVPVANQTAFRYYPPELVSRIRFIKRAQDLGFTLDEIGELLQLNDGADRRSIRRITANRLQAIRQKMADLTRMELALTHLLFECEAHGSARSCPIIAAIAEDAVVVDLHR